MIESKIRNAKRISDKLVLLKWKTGVKKNTADKEQLMICDRSENQYKKKKRFRYL